MARRGFQGMMMRGFGARDHDAVVTGTEQIAPHFRRVRMSSPSLFEDVVPGPTAWIRIWFPDPDGSDTEYQRGYTFSECDPETGDFAVDFVLHEPAGPASTWAQRAEPGDVISVTSFGSRGFDIPDELPAGYLLIGDSASIPGINSIIEALPRDVAIELYLEKHDDNDELIPMPDHPLLRKHWVPRRDHESFAAAIEDRDWSNWYAWVAPESNSLKHLRTRLRDEFGFPKSEVYAQAYWHDERAMGKERTHEAEPARSETAPPTSEPEATPARGTWRAQGGGRLLAPLKRTLIAAGVLQAVVTLIQLAPFVLLTELARRLFAGAPNSELWFVGFWAIGLTAAGTLLAAALSLWLHLVDARFERDLRHRLLGALSTVPLGWFTARDSGQVKRVVQNDTLSLHYLVTHAVPDAVAAVVAPVAVLVYLFAVDWRLALVLFLPILVYLVLMTVMMSQSGPRTVQSARWAERMDGEAAAYLDGQPVIRVFGGAAASTFRARLGEYVRFLVDWQRPMAGKKTLIDLATRPATFLLLLTALGTTLITAGSMAPATLLPFLFLGTTFGSRLLGLGYGLGGLRDGMLAARGIQAVLDEQELRTADRTGVQIRDASTAVEFDDVRFSYRPGVPVIDGVSLTLASGTVTALVGPSGSGKSTLAALLARFHDLASGSIRIFGRDIREMTTDELYQQVGFVFQQTQLVHGTVRENIALAVPDATDQMIEEAARAAHIHDRIMALPDGYDTLVGANTPLSGGEQQRITIARAILADTPILILDEATAYADPESEYFVQRALDRLMAGRTVLVIAHRLHTVTGVHRIAVLDHGRVVETGTHHELFAARGRYRKLWNAATAPSALVTPVQETAR
nr:ABC transporter ATP-binding protein/permease [Rhodococcus pyridinivorans]